MSDPKNLLYFINLITEIQNLQFTPATHHQNLGIIVEYVLQAGIATNSPLTSQQFKDTLKGLQDPFTEVTGTYLQNAIAYESTVQRNT